MRIAYLIPDPGIPIGGTKGASVHVASLTEALVRLGAEVSIFAPKIEGEPKLEADIINIDLGNFKKGLAGEMDRIEKLTHFYEEVEVYMKNHRFDAIYERLSLFAGGGELEQRLDLPRVVEVNAPVTKERMEHFGLANVEVALGKEYEALKDATVVCVSKPLATWAVSRGAKSSKSIPNGADVDVFSPERWYATRDRLRESLGLTGKVVLGFIGSLKPWHGVETIFDAVEHLSYKDQIAILVVGDGPLRSRVNQRIEDLQGRIPTIAVGAVDRKTVPAYLSAIDIALAPYLPTEEFYFSPLKIVGAMAAGNPFIASDFPPIREIGGTAGVYFPAGDSMSLANEIDRLARSKPLRKYLAQQVRTLACSSHDWTNVASATLEVLRSEEASRAA